MTKQELLEKQTRYYDVAGKTERTEEDQRDYEAINISSVANQIMMIEQKEKQEAIRQEAARLKAELEQLRGGKE